MQQSRPLASRHDTVRRGGRAPLPLSILLLSAGLIGPLSALAQTQGPQPQATAPSDAIKQREQELEATRVEQTRASEAQTRLKAEIAAIGQDPDKRNYIVSSQRLREAGFTARRTLDEGIEELLKGYRMMGRGLFKNAA